MRLKYWLILTCVLMSCSPEEEEIQQSQTIDPTIGTWLYETMGCEGATGDAGIVAFWTINQESTSLIYGDPAVCAVSIDFELERTTTTMSLINPQQHTCVSNNETTESCTSASWNCNPTDDYTNIAFTYDFEVSANQLTTRRTMTQELIDAGPVVCNNVGETEVQTYSRYE